MKPGSSKSFLQYAAEILESCQLTNFAQRLKRAAHPPGVFWPVMFFEFGDTFFPSLFLEAKDYAAVVKLSRASTSVEHAEVSG